MLSMNIVNDGMDWWKTEMERRFRICIFVSALISDPFSTPIYSGAVFLRLYCALIEFFIAQLSCYNTFIVMFHLHQEYRCGSLVCFFPMHLGRCEPSIQKMEKFDSISGLEAGKIFVSLGLSKCGLEVHSVLVACLELHGLYL
jgi:hypothetical protein